MYIFLEDSEYSYSSRTKINASADATIAFAVDFTTSGEELTKKYVLDQKKLYIPIDAKDTVITQERIDKVVKLLNSKNVTTINIAGNGIYTANKYFSQKTIDDFVYSFLKKIVESKDFRCKIELFRSGGQTGFDEAGSKAAHKLGFISLVYAPNLFRFRTINGDFANEVEFKKRFVDFQEYRETYIPHNIVSGVEQYGMLLTAREEIRKCLGDNVTSIDMIDYGFRTRTTRSHEFMENVLINEGDLIYNYSIVNGNLIAIPAIVTAIYGRDDRRFRDHWNREGWDENSKINLNHFSEGAEAIEFKNVLPNKEVKLKYQFEI